MQIFLYNITYYRGVDELKGEGRQKCELFNDHVSHEQNSKSFEKHNVRAFQKRFDCRKYQILIILGQFEKNRDFD